MLVRFARDYQYETLSEFVAAGLRSSYAGHAGAREFTVDLSEAFDQMDLTPLEILDAGTRFVVLGRFRVRGRGSGVKTDSTLGQAFWVERGLVVRDCNESLCPRAGRALGSARPRAQIALIRLVRPRPARDCSDAGFRPRQHARGQRP